MTLMEVIENVCHCLHDIGELGLSQLHILVVHEEVAFLSYLKHITGDIKSNYCAYPSILLPYTVVREIRSNENTSISSCTCFSV